MFDCIKNIFKCITQLILVIIIAPLLFMFLICGGEIEFKNNNKN